MPTAEELKAEGNKAFSAKEYKKASKIYRDALKLDPRNPILYSNRAQCFLMLQDYSRALDDANIGINLTADTKMLTKLYFRKATSLLNLKENKKAEFCFRRVLEYEPTNTAAKKELELLKRDVKIISKDVKIPIEVVNTLPEYYNNLLKTEIKQNNTDKNGSLISKEAEDAIDSLFRKKHSTNKANIPTSEPTRPKTTDTKQIGPMAALAGLRNLDGERKEAAYKFVLSISEEDLKSTFEETGVDVEFLEFYIEAGEYSLTHNNVNNDTLLESLKTLASFKRFSLSLLLCNEATVQSFLSKVKRISPGETYDSYEKLLKVPS